MVLRCSLIGHDFGDPEVDREREERGSEVVAVVTEYETCARCGERNVISENTEVTSIAGTTGSDDGDDSDDESADPDVIDADAADGVVDGAVDDTIADDSADLDADAATTDDAEILEHGPADSHPDPDRGRGEWPDSDDVGPPVGAESEPAAWPDSDGEELAFDDEQVTPEDDAVIVDADDGTADVDSAAGIASAGSAPAPGEGAPPEGVSTEFFCPRCSFVSPGDRGSLRPGDICPECRKGYLGEREC